MGLRVASYNVLADGYIRASYYPLTPAADLDPRLRLPAVAARAAALGADVLCLQEAEAAMLAAIGARLPGHEVHRESKIGRRDAVAILTTRPVVGRERLVFPDGASHVAVLVAVEDEGRRLGVACTHVKWDPPGERVGTAQVEALLDAIDAFTPRCDGWLVAGDFNATLDSETVGRVIARGLRDAYADLDAPTCNAHQNPRRIDFLFHSPSLVAVPEVLPPITRETALPSAVEPSDHLPISASLDWLG